MLVHQSWCPGSSRGRERGLGLYNGSLSHATCNWVNWQRLWTTRGSCQAPVGEWHQVTAARDTAQGPLAPALLEEGSSGSQDLLGPSGYRQGSQFSPACRTGKLCPRSPGRPEKAPLGLAETRLGSTEAHGVALWALALPALSAEQVPGSPLALFRRAASHQPGPPEGPHSTQAPPWGHLPEGMATTTFGNRTQQSQPAGS